MTPLRQKMHCELQLHRKSPRTIEAYVTAVAPLWPVAKTCNI
jgi:hypothetical protein